MQKFRYNMFRDLKAHHIQILRAHTNTVAFHRRIANDYAAAAKPQDMTELKNKLFARARQPEQMHPMTEK